MSNPEDQIRELAPSWLLPRRPGLKTDPINMEYVIEQVDPALATPLVATQLETVAAVYRAIADGAAKAAQIVSGKSQ
jgi:hypothetical protein